MENFGCFAVISDGFATYEDKCKNQCEDCKHRYPEPIEKIYVKYHKSDKDWRLNVFTVKEFGIDKEKEAIEFWHLMTNNHRGTTGITREKRFKINHLPGDVG